MNRWVLFLLLGVVAVAAAVLSFAALRDLALVCGFSPQLAWLLPVTVDAGAAAGSLVWLGRASVREAVVFARALALGLMALSVAANAVGHGLAAFNLRPEWWVVVIVSAIAPTVLGAVVHLAVLVGRHEATLPTDEGSKPTGPTDADRTSFMWAVDEATGSRIVRLYPDGSEELVAGHDLIAAGFSTDPTTADRPEVDPPMTDGQIIAEVREWAVDLGRRPSRDEMLGRYKIGATRCRRLRNLLGWIEPLEPADQEPTAVEGTDR